MRNLALSLLAVVGLTACGGGSSANTMTGTEMASQIRPDLLKQFHNESDGKLITITKLDCVIQSSTTGRCFAKLHDSTPEVEVTDVNMAIKVTFDKSNGTFIWESEQ